MTKYLIVQQTGSVYWMFGDAIAYAPIDANNSFYIDPVNPDLVDEEFMEDDKLDEPYGHATTFGELHKIVRNELMHRKYAQSEGEKEE